MNLYKRIFIICFMFFISFFIISCRKKEYKTEFELFIEEYYKHHPTPYTLEEGLYSIRTYQTSYTNDNEYEIEEQNYIGTICFQERKLNGYLSNFTYELNKINIKNNCIFSSINKKAYCYNNEYYETLKENEKTTTYGCENIQLQDIQFRAHTSVESLTRYLFFPDMLLYSLEYKSLIKSVIVEGLQVKMIFEIPMSEDEILEHIFTYNFDDQYKLLKVIRTSTYHTSDSATPKYFFTSTLEKKDNYSYPEIELEYDQEKTFQSDDLYFVF